MFWIVIWLLTQFRYNFVWMLIFAIFTVANFTNFYPNGCFCPVQYLDICPSSLTGGWTRKSCGCSSDCLIASGTRCRLQPQIRRYHKTTGDKPLMCISSVILTRSRPVRPIPIIVGSVWMRPLTVIVCIADTSLSIKMINYVYYAWRKIAHCTQKMGNTNFLTIFGVIGVLCYTSW